MPCRDDSYHDDLINRLNIATNVACEAMRLIEANKLDHKIAIASLDWWREHKKRDAERLARETDARQRACARAALRKKLTPEERKLVGL